MTDFSAHKIAPGDADYVEKYNALLDELNSSVNAIKGQIGSTKVYEPDVHLFTENQAVKRAVGELSVERATDATYFDKYDVMRTAAVDEIRLNEKGVLIESSSENMLLNSRPIDGSSTRCILTEDSTKGVDGVSLATKMTVDLMTGNTATVSFGYTTVADGKSYIKSVFAKSGNGSGAGRFLLLETDGFSVWSNSGRVMFDLVDGTVVDGTGLVYTSGNYSITKIGDWYLCSITMLCMLDFTVGNELQMWDGETSTANFNGNGTDYIYIDRIQVEEGGGATSHIPTAGTPIPRGADNISLPALNNIPASTQPQSIAVYVEKHGFDVAEIVWSAGHTNDDFRVYFSKSSTEVFVRFEASGLSIIKNLGYPEQFKGLLICTFDGANIDFYIDEQHVGTRPVTQTNSNVLANPIEFGHQTGYFRANSIHLKDFRIWDGYVLSESDRALLLAEYS
jgi:hypothetical protein